MFKNFFPSSTLTRMTCHIVLGGVLLQSLIGTSALAGHPSGYIRVGIDDDFRSFLVEKQGSLTVKATLKVATPDGVERGSFERSTNISPNRKEILFSHKLINFKDLSLRDTNLPTGVGHTLSLELLAFEERMRDCECTFTSYRKAMGSITLTEEDLTKNISVLLHSILSGRKPTITIGYRTVAIAEENPQ